MVQARGRVDVGQPRDPILRRTGHHEPVGDLARSGFERAPHVSRGEGLGDRGDLLRIYPVSFEQRRGHRGDVERGEDPPRATRDVAIGCDRAEQRVAEVEPGGAPSGALGADPEVVDRVAERIG